MPERTGSDQWVLGVPEIAAVSPEEIAALNAGSINQAWRVMSSEGTWVVRRNAIQPEVDRKLECRILHRVAEAGLAPAVIACQPTYQITRWVDGAQWRRGDLSDSQRIDDLARRLRQLHGLKADDIPATRWGDRICELLAFSDCRENPALRTAVSELASELDQSSLTIDQQALCHFDLHVDQILGLDPVCFVDFEYARRANPMLDLAWLTQYHDLTPDEQLPLLASYYGGADPQLRELLALALRLVRLLEYFWLEARLSEGRMPESDRSRLRQLRLVLC